MEVVPLENDQPEIQLQSRESDANQDEVKKDFNDTQIERHVNSNIKVNGDQFIATDKTGDQQQLTHDLQEIVNEAATSSMESLLPSNGADNIRARTTSDVTPFTPPTTPLRKDSLSSPSLLEWLNPNTFLSKVKEKAMNSVDSMIMTLDPGMKEFICSGGDVNLVVASDKDVKVASVRNAFIDVFGRATVSGVAVDSSASPTAIQPVGNEAALKAAQGRIDFIRTSMTSCIPQNQVILAIESFIQEVTQDSWFESSILLLDDPLSKTPIIVYSQATPIPLEAVNHLSFETSKDYEFRGTGFSQTIGHFMSSKMNVSHDSWHEAVTGISRRSLLYMSATAMANLYRQRLVALTNKVHNV